jgi:hypothetical protein
MKKLLVFSTLLMLTLAQASAQKNPIDELFDRYSGRDGITTVYISSRMLSLFADLAKDDKEVGDVVTKLTSIRIITIDDSTLNKSVNFYSELGKKLNYKEFEELMVVKDGTETVKFLIKESGDKITELLMVSGGTSNSLISIRGEIDLKSISKLSGSIGISELEKLDSIDRKQVVKK